MTVWLYTINPRAPAGWTYGWDVRRPETLLASSDKVWPTANFFRKLAVGDQIAVYMKEMGAACDGIYIVGDITAVDQDTREFTWRPDRATTAPLLGAPLPTDVVREFFGRGYGGAIRRIKPEMEREWARLVAGLTVRSTRSAASRAAPTPATSRRTRQARR